MLLFLRIKYSFSRRFMFYFIIFNFKQKKKQINFEVIITHNRYDFLNMRKTLINLNFYLIEKS